MNYGGLKTAVLSDSHRPDLSAEVARFVRECEGMIRRDLRAYVVNTTLTETDRVSGGVYTLPSGLLEIRSIHRADEDEDGLQRVSPNVLRRLPTTASPLQYAQRGNGQIEIRGTPGTDSELDLLYLGHPAAFSDDADENDLLTNHEALYTQGSLFALYRHTQDMELAQGALDVFTNVIEKLNEQIARQIGGNNVAPAYNFAGGGSY